MVTLVNRAKMTTPTTGTGPLTLGAAVAGFQSFAAAGVGNGDLVYYVIEEGEAWEIGTGSYHAVGPSLSRSVLESSANGAAIALAGKASVFLTALAQDLLQPGDALSRLTNDLGFTTATGTVTSVAASAGTGISVTGGPIITSGTLTITNTAPDRTVTLTPGANVTITGSYPSFTIAATNTNTTYSAGNGLSLSGTTFSVAGGTGLSQLSTGLALTAISAGASTTGALFYNGTARTAGRLYGGTTNPASTTRLNYDGNLHVNALIAVGDVTAFSDARLKTDIAPIEDALSSLCQLRGVTYRRLDDPQIDETGAIPRRNVGLIAQEVEAVFPEVVQTLPCGTRSLAYGNLVAVLIEAIKTLTERIARLEAR